MVFSFLNSFKSEWLKKKGSLAAWLILVGSLFIPTIVTLIRVVKSQQLPLMYSTDDFWALLWQNNWETMAFFILPVGVILLISLLTQVEFKNNTWKQLHTLPQSLLTIFVAKLAVTILMMLQFFILFNIGIYSSALIPYLLFSDIVYPQIPIPWVNFLQDNFYFFIDCLPIIAFQYLISLQHKNFLVPVGIGILLWIASLTSLSWKFGYLLPYTYTMYDFIKSDTQSTTALPVINIHFMSFGYFTLFIIVGYVFYFFKKEKG